MVEDNGLPLSLEPVVLASASRTRLDMLRNAGLDVEAIASGLDERAIIDAVAAGPDGLPPADVAAILAEAKAQAVSQARAGALVIGADQTLELDGNLFTKPTSMEEARHTLLQLSGKTHHLHSAVSLVRDGETLWAHTATASLAMRACSPAFIGHYSAAAGEAILESVGCYQLEGLGAQLFRQIDGDFFTVLGLPLLPLLAKLRDLKILET